jgi:exodeoxyribonuclease V gamma subunit
MTELLVHRAPDAAALAAELAGRLRGTRADPFAVDVVVTPHPHLRRWLTNELAQLLGRPGEGICAGVAFVTPGRLLHDLGDPVRFWHPRQLAWRLLQVAADHADEPRLDQLRRHLTGSRNPYRVAHRLAADFHRYLLWRPDLVAGWQAGRDTDEQGADLGFDAWQPVLWRLAAAVDDPQAATASFLDRLRAEPSALALPAELSFVQPDPLSPWWVGVLEALAAHRSVQVSLIDPSVAAATGPAARLTAFGRGAQAVLLSRSTVLPLAPGEPPTSSTLGWLQQTLAGECPASPAPDDSVQVHGGHGLERQVEILRDAITGLLAADPTLEPRHIIVGCPNLKAAAPLIQAAFRLPPGVPGRHPANDFRVQVADRSSADVNPLVGALVQALRLITSRAEAAEVIDFCARPVVAARFGLEADSLERLTHLAGAAGVRWGLSARHRERFELGTVAQNTWWSGLQRMLLGTALGETGLPMVGTVLPLDDVEDGDLTLLGGVAELLSRLLKLATEYAEPATLAEWVVRLQWAVDAFTLVSGNDVWQRTDALGSIAQLAERGAGPTTLSLAEITDLVSDEFERGQARSTFGNGSLTVCSLRSLRGVPYRVVCLLGLDDGVFPHGPGRDGDDLMQRDIRPGEPDPPAEDRQSLADAIMAARQALVVVHQARSAQTNEEIPPPSALADLLDLLGQAGVHERPHPLQPFSPTLFGADGPPRSYDPAGLRGAFAVSGPRRPPALDTAVPPAPALVEVGLDELLRFVRDPAKHFLRERCGLAYWEADEVADDIPIELDGLQRWAVGERMLGLLRAGHSPDEVAHAEWLRGSVPPGELGTRLLTGLGTQLAPIITALPPEAGAPVVHHDIAVDCGPVRVVGRVATQQNLVLQATFAKPSESRRIEAWLRLVALSAADDRDWQALLVAHGGDAVRWLGPDRATARALLDRWVRLYRIGLDVPVPVPLRFGARVARVLDAGGDPLRDNDLQWAYRDHASRQLRQFYPELADVWNVPVGADDLDQPGETLLALAAARLIWHPLTQHEGVPA